MAIYELKLVRIKVSDIDPHPIKKSADTVDYLLNHGCFSAEDAWRERVVLITLNRELIPTGFFHLSVGGVNSCTIDRLSAVRVAVMAGADSVIVSHNHPSSSSRPSQTDIRETNELTKSFSVFGIKLIDHVIISNDEYFSFSDEVVVKRKGLL